ncbi:MAG: hypothetical protein M3N45_14860 [Actinomycetota bacterium]|nr:hypothetical protein [Actinomycetota bacterium]
MAKQAGTEQTNPIPRACTHHVTQIKKGTRGLLETIDKRVTIVSIILTFWTAFWLLNGFDKFFNSEYFYGVTRDAEFVDYFARLSLPADVALITLYTISIVEIILGFGFLYTLLYSRYRSLVGTLSFKLSLLIFACFSIGDILFGDRAELWEHGTFMVLVIVSSSFYLHVGKNTNRPEDQGAQASYPMVVTKAERN